MSIKAYDLIKNKIPMIREVVFYILLTIELCVALVEKSDLHNPYESYIFRATFVLSLIVIMLSEFNIKEWIFVVLFNILGLCCYKITCRNDLWRYIVFALAATRIDFKRALKYTFWVNLIGCGIIALLSISGIYGKSYLYAQYREGVEDEIRYTFGFGHPNGMHAMFLVLILLGIYVYHEKCNWIHYLLMAVANYIVYYFSDSRTSFLITGMAIVLGVIYRYGKETFMKWVPYVIALASFIGSLAISIWSSIATYYSWSNHTIDKIDNALNGRIKDLYWGRNSHGGYILTWSLFSTKESHEYFDMGWVRLFYWCGIIPTIIILVLFLLVIIYIWKIKDKWTALMIAMISIYTIIEAHFISDYIGRNFLMITVGAYWCLALGLNGAKEKYFWKVLTRNDS
jgi:hypothetical protein